MTPKNDTETFKQWLMEQFLKERKKTKNKRCKKKRGIYTYTQKLMGFKSNAMECGHLSLEQTADLYDTGSIQTTDGWMKDKICAKDIEEMHGHFLMFDHMLDTIDQELSEQLILNLHYLFLTGVFEDRENGYEIGKYRQQMSPQLRGGAAPKKIKAKMAELLLWYHEQPKNWTTVTKFHVLFHEIRPFAIGTEQVERMILFRESLKYKNLEPFILGNVCTLEYFDDRDSKEVSKIIPVFKAEAKVYRELCQSFMEDPRNYFL